MRIPILALIAFYILTAAVDAYIWRDIRQYANPKRRKLWTGVFGTVAVLLLTFLVVLTCWPLRDENRSVYVAMWMLYSYSTIYFPLAIYVICSMIGRCFHRKGERNINYGVWVGIPLAVLVCIVMWWGALFTRYEIEVKEVTIESERLPAAFDGFRITQFSDAHVGTWLKDTTFVAELVLDINATHPDIILFTGDIVNRRTSELEPFLQVLSRLKAPYGVYSVLGNHDYGDYIDWKDPGERETNNALLAAWERQMGWHLLNNDHVNIGIGRDTIALIGVENWGEPPFKQYGNLRGAYGKQPGTSLYDDRYKILMTHNPEHWHREVVKQSNIDLTLSGHTHAMQAMWQIGPLRISPVQLRYKLWGGLYTDTASNPGIRQDLYINIGSGEVAIPARIGDALPEITVLTLKKKLSATHEE